jgi:hypothetical protein
MDAKNYLGACRKLEEVTRLVPEGIGARLTLGECYEALGKLASAWSQYAVVETMAVRFGQPERAQRAAERTAMLRPKLAMLTIEVPAGVRAIPGFAITRDGVSFGGAQWGTPLPVDAGGHEIVATAPGYKAWTKHVEVVADGARVVAKVVPLVVDSSAGTSPGGLPPIVQRLDAPPDRSWQRPVGIAAMATGAVGVGAGAILGGLAIAQRNKSNADNHCDARNTCDPEGLALRNQAVDLGNASTASLVAGAAVLAGGVVLFVTAPPQKNEKEEKQTKGANRRRWIVGLEPLVGGVRVTGAW